MEEWLPINGNEQYAISNLGNVKHTISNRQLKVYPPRLLKIKRMIRLRSENVQKLFETYVMIPINTPDGRRRRKYFVKDLKHAYENAWRLLNEENPPVYVE